MNKLFADGPDGKKIICILEPGNLKRLVEERKPIEISLNEGPYEKGLPAKLKIMVFYSETPVGDSLQFEKLLAPGSFVDNRRLPVTLTKKPHCAECSSVIEQLMVWKQEGSPWVVCCGTCGAAFGVMAPMENIIGKKVTVSA